MKEITLSEIKKIEVDILEYFDYICKKNNIRYYLTGGTLLGAVRHKGFIPWDDDIDVVMPREDYNRVIEILEKNNEGKYKIFSISNVQKYIYPFAKLINSETILNEKVKNAVDGLGVYIDIFPIDGLPNNKFLMKIHYLKIRILKTLLFLNFNPDFKKGNILLRFLKLICYIPSNIIGSQRIIKRMEKMVKKYKFDDCNNIGVITAGYGIKEIMPKSIYKDTAILEFEGKKYPAPKKYEEYLTRIYGDFMKLPPEEERVTHHHYDVYWKSEK